MGAISWSSGICECQNIRGAPMPLRRGGARERSISTAMVSLAEVFHPRVCCEGPGSGLSVVGDATTTGGGVFPGANNKRVFVKLILCGSCF